MENYKEKYVFEGESYTIYHGNSLTHIMKLIKLNTEIIIPCPFIQNQLVIYTMQFLIYGYIIPFPLTNKYSKYILKYIYKYRTNTF